MHHATVRLPLVIALETALRQQPLAGVASCLKTKRNIISYLKLQIEI